MLRRFFDGDKGGMAELCWLGGNGLCLRHSSQRHALAWVVIQNGHRDDKGRTLKKENQIASLDRDRSASR